MQKKLFFVIILMLLMASVGAVYVEVGSGTTTVNYIPTYGWYSYGWSRTIYLETNLNNAMDINTISYNVSNTPTNFVMENQSFYMKHTSSSTIASTSYIDPTTDTTYQLVYSGNITFNGGGWFDLILDTPFAYNGTDNLEILVLNNDGSYASSYPTFVGTTVTPERAVYKYADGSFPATSGTLSATYPNTRFHFSGENEPGIVTLATPANNSFNIATPVELTWTNGTDTDWINVYLSSNSEDVVTMNLSALLADNYTQETYTVDDLAPLSTYYWKIVAGNNISEYLLSSPVWKFTTSAADGSIVIGNGEVVNAHLPMEPFYGYSITQSIYDQEWLNVENQRIEQISYYTNGYSAWTENNIQIYLGHTNLDVFATTSAWIPSANLMLVYDGPLVVPAVAGWVTLPLIIPFNYNNTDNLVVAFEANTQGYSGSNDEFFCTPTTGNKSIWQYSDSVNSNFINPAVGTLSANIPNILLTMGDIPTTPQLMITPVAYSWGNTIINSSANTVTFSMRNTGLGALTINSVALDQATNFILTDTNTYPLDITNNVFQFTATFHPLTVGDFTANIIINDAEIGNTAIPLTGTGYDAMINDFPHFEGFEGYAVDTLPLDWSSVITSSSTLAIAGVHSTAYEGTRGFRLYNSADANAQIFAITPPVNSLTSRRIRFMGKSSTAGTGLIIGTAENNNGDINFTARDTVMFTTEFQQFQHGFSTADEDAQFIALKYVGAGITYLTVTLDNFYVETIPTGPAIVINQSSLDFGNVYLNRFGVVPLRVENWGIDPLEVELTQTGTELSFNPSEVTIPAGTSRNITVSLTPFAEGNYSGSFNVLSNDATHPSITISTSAFILPALPENIAIIGDGNTTNQGLPLEPYWRHSLTQSIYYAGEIGITGQRIEKISWNYNGYEAWGPDELKIYMGLTSATQFNGTTDWMNINNMTEVFNGTISVPATAGWVETELDIPFIYDISQNLVVGVFHSAPSWHSSSSEFYCTPSTPVRSMLYYSDSIIPDPAAPPVAGYMRNSFPNITLEFGVIPNAPDLTVFPTNSVFEMVPVNGTSLEKTISMRSIGLQDITIASAPTITGTNATEFSITTDNNTYPLVLPFNQLTTIGIKFTPSTEGSKSATLQIIDNATRVTRLVTLSGYAYADDGNDTPVGATTLTLPVNGAIYAIMPIGDIDWYKIPAMGVGDTLIARTADAGGTVLGTSLWLYGPVDTPTSIVPNIYLATGTNINFVLPQSGNYYLRVARTNAYPEGVNPPHIRKSQNAETNRFNRDETGLYSLFVDANYNYDFNAPLTLVATNQSGYIELSWVEPPYERYLTGYKVYRDGSLITQEMIPIGTNLYHDANVVVGTEYTYHVVGMYDDPDGFSLPSNNVTIIYYNLGTPLWGDDFEEHPDFALNMPNWIQYDLDGGSTYGISNVEFDNAGEAMSYMVFNPASTTPPITDMLPQSGDKFLTSFASTEGQNDDWIVTPRIIIGTTTVVSFYAKSYTADYGLERFRVKMSLGGSAVSNFQYSLHQGVEYLEAPTEWTPFTFNISQLTGNAARFAIQCISAEAFVLMIDNFRIDSTDDGVDNEDVENIPQVNALNQNYPNPFNPETSISFSLKEAGNVSLDIYNIKGQKVKTLLNEYKTAGSHSLVWNGRDENNSNVASGVYFYKMRNGTFSSTRKMILMK